MSLPAPLMEEKNAVSMPLLPPSPFQKECSQETNGLPNMASLAFASTFAVKLKKKAEVLPFKLLVIQPTIN